MGSADRRSAWEERDRLEKEATAAAEVKQGEWVEALCLNRSFIVAKSHDERRKVAISNLPELAEAMMFDEDDHTKRPWRWATGRAIREAEGRVKNEIRPQIVKDAMRRTDELIEQLKRYPIWSEATTKKERESVARRFIEETIGFAVPVLVFPLVRAATASNGRLAHAAVTATARP
jgi:hypothetical protein